MSSNNPRISLASVVNQSKQQESSKQLEQQATSNEQFQCQCQCLVVIITSSIRTTGGNIDVQCFFVVSALRSRCRCRRSVDRSCRNNSIGMAFINWAIDSTCTTDWPGAGNFVETDYSRLYYFHVHLHAQSILHSTYVHTDV